MVSGAYILKGDLIGFPDGLDVGYEREREGKMTPRLSLNFCRDGAAIN